MTKLIAILTLILLPGVSAASSEQAKVTARTLVTLETTAGTITLELLPGSAPKSVSNFLWYVDSGYYDGIIFHRVIEDYVVQAGKDRKGKRTQPPIENEATNGLSNLRGTIAVARSVDPHSGMAQFFINIRHNPSLDFRGEHLETWGYAVFGRVLTGMEVVDAIANGQTTTRNGEAYFPIDPVVILRARRKSSADAQTSMAADGYPRDRSTVGCVEGNCQSGFGVYVYEDDDIYEGNWQNAKPHGDGVYFFVDGRPWIEAGNLAGTWMNGKKHGKFSYLVPGGVRQVQAWYNDENVTEKAERCRAAKAVTDAYQVFVALINGLVAGARGEDVVEGATWGYDAAGEQLVPRAVDLTCEQLLGFLGE